MEESTEGIELNDKKSTTSVEKTRTRWEELSIGAKKSLDKLFKLGEYKEISLAEAIGRIDKAPSIIEDKGVSVFGHEVEDPLAFTVKYLQESMKILTKKEGDSVNCGRLYEVLGDIFAKDTSHDEKVDRREWDEFIIAQYDEAMRIYNGAGDTRRYWDVDLKNNVIKGGVEDVVLSNGEHYGYRKDLLNMFAEERRKRREEDHNMHRNKSV
ncbi:MAG: hypothetical protein WA052_02340 [Microgenomates group bacterium]